MQIHQWVPMAKDHCEVPRDVTSEILERVGFQAGGSESVAERNGREKGRVIERMGKEGGSQNQSRQVFGRITQSDRLCVTKCHSKVPFWRTMSRINIYIYIYKFGTPKPQPLPLSQAHVHKVTEWRTIQKYHNKD